VKGDEGEVLDRSEIHKNVDFLTVDPVSQEQDRSIEIAFQGADRSGGALVFEGHQPPG